MIFRLPRFLRRYFRRNMHPMAESQAWAIKHKIAILYAIIAWHAAGFAMYQMLKGNKHWPITKGIRSKDEDIGSPAMQWARSLGIEKANVVRIGTSSGISESRIIEIPKNPEEDLTTLTRF